MSIPVLNNLDLNGNQLIQALAEVLGTNPSALLSEGRFWVNSTTHKFIVRLNGVSVSFYGDTTTLDAITVAAADLDINTHKIINVVDPTAAQHAATKNYVDTRKLSDFVAPSADVSMASHKLTLVTDPTSAQDAATKAYVDARRLDQAVAPTTNVSLNSHKITNLLDPTGAQDAASKNYVDTVSQGLAPKESVVAASTGNVAIGPTGALGTAGHPTLDGVDPLPDGARILLKDQTAPAENGIYTIDAANRSVVGRASDADSTTDIESAFVFVEQGTVNGNTMWLMTTDSVVIDTTAQTWVQFASVISTTAGNGLSLAGTVLSVNVDGTTIEINTDTLRVKASGITANELGTNSVTTAKINALAVTDAKINDVAASKITGQVAIANGGTAGTTAATARANLGAGTFAAGNITGDGSSVALTFDHNLNTKDVVVSVWEATTDAEVQVNIVRTTVNRLTFNFGTAPANGKVYRVVVGALA